MKIKLEHITADDISITSSYRPSYRGFMIERLSENVFPDSMAWPLGNFIEGKGYSCDEFNVEYMGHLVGQISPALDEETFAKLINEFIDEFVNGSQH